MKRVSKLCALFYIIDMKYCLVHIFTNTSVVLKLYILFIK
jgi:hypothetical protein